MPSEDRTRGPAPDQTAHPTPGAGPDPTTHPLHLVTRRRFIAGSGAAIASAGAVTVATAQDATPGATPGATPAGTPGSTPIAPAATSPPTTLLAPEDAPLTFFTVDEATTVDALVSRILPGTADDPGAHEAGVVVYIDRVLGGTNLGYDLKTYTQGPYLGITEEPVPVEASTATDIYRNAIVNTDDIPRYGFQSVMSPQQIYRRGLASVDAYAQSALGGRFVDLDGAQQDQVVAALADDSATGFEAPGARAFFQQMRNDTIEGMFSDPMYGGNRDMAGWRLIGYPGAQFFYSPDDMMGDGPPREPQSLMQMMANHQH